MKETFKSFLSLPAHILNNIRLEKQKEHYECFFDKDSADILSRTKDFNAILRNLKPVKLIEGNDNEK